MPQVQIGDRDVTRPEVVRAIINELEPETREKLLDTRPAEACADGGIAPGVCATASGGHAGLAAARQLRELIPSWTRINTVYRYWWFTGCCKTAGVELIK